MFKGAGSSNMLMLQLQYQNIRLVCKYLNIKSAAF